MHCMTANYTLLLVFLTFIIRSCLYVSGKSERVVGRGGGESEYGRVQGESEIVWVLIFPTDTNCRQG